ARLVAGFVVQESVSAQPHVWVEVLAKGRWEPFDPDNGYARDLPADFLPARYDGTDTVRGTGLTELNSQFSVTAIPPPGHALARRGQHLTDLWTWPVCRWRCTRWLSSCCSCRWGRW
ncbi:MAG: hypothetical protein U1E05_16830, partial [Patescibacteria group bacterium]|nr:hypothetical protein [Patescibacteria group bacterium]